MDEDVTADGLPILKKQATTSTTDEGLPILKKKANTIAPVNGATSLPTGLNPFQSSQANIPYSGITTTPEMQQQLVAQDDQVRQQRQSQQDAINKQLKPYFDKLSPQEKADLSQHTLNSIVAHNNEQLSAPTKEETDAYNFSQTPTGKIVNGAKYLGQKVTKGGLQVAKGAAYLADIGAKLQTPTTALNAFDGSPEIDKGFEKADKATDFLSKGDVSRVEDSKVMANLGGLAEFLPSAIAGESTGGATFYLQGLGQGKETIEQAEKNGAKINPVVKNAFILGTGAVNGLLMGDLGKGIFKPLTSALKDDIVANITTNAIKDAAGKDITAEGFKNLLQKGAQEWTDKALQGGANYLKNTKKVVVDLSALNVGNFALKQGVDAANEAPVFNENLGNLAEQEGETLKAAPMFGAIGSMHDLSKLTPYSSYKNAIVDNLMQDSSPDNIAKTKEFITQHGEQQGWTPEQIQATNGHIDQIGAVTKSLPKGLPDAKIEPAVDLVLGRNELQEQLAKEQENRKQLDPALNEEPTAHEQFLTDKIEQANDKLRDIATGKRTTYSREIGDDGAHEEKFFKTVGGKSEEITESRYNLERAERDAKAKPQENNEQTEPNQEVPIEQPTNETGQTAEVVAPVNEASGDSKVIPHPNEVNVLSDKAHKIQNEETDKKIVDFQSKFPEHKIDPLEDLPESVVRTFDRVDADAPTDPVAINEASDWLYNKYKQLTAMKESDTRRLTIPQIEAMQEQLGEDITTLENHKQKYHGEELTATEPAKTAEVKPTEQATTVADENGGSGTATKPSQEKIKAGNTDATKIESAGKMDVGKPSGDSGTLGEGNTGHKESTGESQLENGSSEVSQQRAEEVKPTTAAKNATTDEIAAKLGVDLNYDKGGKRTKEVVEGEADKELKDGYDVHELIDKITNDKHKATDTETVILAKHIAAKETRIKEIDSDIEANGATMPKAKFDALLNEKTQSQNDFQDGAYALKKTGTETARALGARRFNVNNDYSLADMITRKREAVGDKLTAEQLDDVTKRFNELEKANKDYEARIAKLEADNARLEAEKAMKRVKDAASKTTKPSLTKEQVKEQLAKERKQIADDFSKKLKEMRESGALNDVFKASAEFLAAAAPYVAKMVHNLAKEGVLELKDVIEKIRDELDLKDLSDRDITDLISGKYNEKAPTKSELQERVADLKQQAKLIGQIEDAENGLKGLKNGSNGQKKQSVKVEELRQRLAELTKEPAKDPEEQRLHQSKVAVNKTIRELTDKINAGAFTRDKPTPVKPDAELLTLRRERDKLREDFDLGVARDKLAQRTKLEKAKHIALDIASLPRALKATLDFSAVLRQGMILGISHPTKAADAFIKMFGQTFSEKKYHDWISDIKHHPQYDLMKESGLYISEKHNPDILAREEEFTSNLAEKIPIIGKSIKYKGKTIIPGIDAIGGAERAYSSYLNVLRTGVFLDGADKLQRQGYTFENNPEQFKSLAKVINIFSGRGDIPEFLGGKQPTILSSLFFSPRFWASRIQSLYLYGDTRLTKQARITAAKDMATALGVVGSLIGMAGLAGFKIQLNPTSPNFLRIQDKDTKYDVLAGLGSNITFLAQEIMGQKMNAKGGIQKMNTGKFNGITRASNMMNFLRGKLSPGVSIPYNLLSGKDYIGNKYDLSNVPGEFVPLPFTDIQDAYKLGGLENALKVFVPAIFGIGVSTYNPNQKPKK